MHPVPRWPRPMLAIVALSALGLIACDGETMSEPGAAPVLARAPADPTVTSTVPSSASRDTTLDVQVIGTGFDQGSRVDFARGGVVDTKLKVNGTAYVKTTLLVASVTIAADAEVAKYDVYVTTSKGKKGIGTERFTVNPILALPLEQGGEALDLNDLGLVVGRDGTPPGPTRPFLWSEAMGVRYLPMAPGGCVQSAWAVNNQGIILASNGCGSSGVPARWVPDGSGSWIAEPLGPAPDGTLPEAVAIDEPGRIVGVRLDPSTNVNRPYLWTEGTGWSPLQTPPTAPSCYVEMINDLGQMVGSCELPGSTQGLIWYLWASPAASPLRLMLPVPTGHVKFGVTGINDSGVLVGWSITCNCSRQVQRALRWTPSGMGYTLTDLGDLGGGEARAEAIDDAGQIVGRATTASKVSHAFLFILGAGMRDLGALGSQDSWAFELTSGPDMPLTIVGRSSVNSVQRAVRWVP